MDEARINGKQHQVDAVEIRFGDVTVACKRGSKVAELLADAQRCYEGTAAGYVPAPDNNPWGWLTDADRAHLLDLQQRRAARRALRKGKR